LADDLHNSLFWASAACLGANIIAPAINEALCGLGLVGLGAALVGRVTARAFGSTCVVLPPVAAVAVPEKLVQATTRHAWPVLIDIPKRKGRHGLSLWLNDQEAKNVVLEIDQHLASALKVSSNWRFVMAEEPLVDADRAKHFGPQILTSWLQNISARKFALSAPPTASLARRVLADMRQWLTLLGHPTDVFDSVPAVLDEADYEDRGKAKYFADTVCRYIEEGKLYVANAGYEKHKETCSVMGKQHPLGEGVFIPRAAVVGRLYADGLPGLDTIPTTAVLQAANALANEPMYYLGQFGWFVKLPWWTKQLEQHRGIPARLLRLVG
jgi:hypothetical protein